MAESTNYKPALAMLRSFDGSVGRPAAAANDDNRYSGHDHENDNKVDSIGNE